jgi:predicted transcriptional regulator
VKKTTVYLEPDVDRALAKLAAAQGLTKAEVIRRALARAAAEAGRRRIEAISIGSGPGDVAGDVDRHLAETGFGE